MKLLIYIPCWTNYRLAIDQVNRIESQITKLNLLDYSVEVDLMVSLNAVDEIDELHRNKLESLGSNFRHFKQNIGDTNINLAFLDANLRGATHLWILSPDDEVSEVALNTIVTEFNQDKNLGFIVADETRSMQQGVQRIDIDGRKLDLSFIGKASYGLVSGLILQTRFFAKQMHFGVQSAFTCWGQLAVFLSGLTNHKNTSGIVIPAPFLYKRTDPKNLSLSRKMGNVENYSNSFFGYVYILYRFSSKWKQEVARWVLKNWYKVGMYKKAFFQNPENRDRIVNSFVLAEFVISKSTLVTRTVFWLGTRLDLSRLARLLSNPR